MQEDRIILEMETFQAMSVAIEWEGGIGDLVGSGSEDASPNLMSCDRGSS